MKHHSVSQTEGSHMLISDKLSMACKHFNALAQHHSSDLREIEIVQNSQVLTRW